MNFSTATRKIISEMQLFTRSFLESLKFVHKTMGVLLVYILCCTFFVDCVMVKLFGRMWSLALKSIPGNYITDQNVYQLLLHPTALVIGTLIVLLFCIICLWQNAGILMIIEYNRQGRPVKLLTVFYESLLQIRHAFHPRNWMIFVYILVILPLIDPNMTMSVFSELAVPEFIMDFIIAKKLLLIIGVIVLFLVHFFFFRFVLVLYSFVLERRSFSEASHRSRDIGLRGQLYVGLTQQILANIARVLYVGLPIAIILAITICEEVMLGDTEYADAAATFLFGSFGVGTCKVIGSSFVKLIVSVYMVNIFHRVCEDRAIPVDIDLTERCIKNKGKVRSFRGWVYASCVVLCLSYIAWGAVLIYIGDNEPDMLRDIVGETEIAAHKGYSSRAPENTMDAFELAVNSDSVNYIELDVRSTRDGVPVVVHNESLKEATGKNISIYDVDFDDLQNMTASYKFKKEYPEARIPSLEEVLGRYGKDKKFIIEIKDSERSPELPNQIVRLMEKYDMVESSVIHSGSYDAISKVKDANPEIRCGYIVAVSMGGYYDLKNADFFSIEHDFATTNVISNIHERGKKVFVWTVNEERSMEDVRFSMIDVVITDYPDDCDSVINSNANLLNQLFETAGEQVGLEELENISDVIYGDTSTDY